MIEKLDVNDTRYRTLIDKLNELIEVFNGHTHPVLSVDGPTGLPKEDEEVDREAT